MDLVIRNAVLPDDPVRGALDIGIEKGRIAALAPGLGQAAEEYDAGGRLVCAGFVETHIHLDKSRIIERCLQAD